MRWMTIVWFVLATAAPVAAQDCPPFEEALGKPVTDAGVSCLLAEWGPVEQFSASGTTYHSNKAKGISFATKADKLAWVYFYAEGVEKNRAFKGQLPGKVSLSDKRPKIRKKLGKPSVFGDKRRVERIDLNAFDKYYYPQHALHVQYAASGKIMHVLVIARFADDTRMEDEKTTK